ncbi:MAG: type IV secretion system protein [Burkholderiales bacterium]|nr:type IV secretion system protein [Burkholderiales bacterium]
MSFWKKKENQRKEPTNVTDTAKYVASPYEEGIDWSVSRMELERKRASLGWGAAKILSIVVVALCVAIVIVSQKQEAYPYIVEIDKDTGRTSVYDIRDPQNIPVNELMDKFWLNEYVLSRETYDWNTLENDYIKVREMSMPEVFEIYASQYGQNKKNSLESTLQDKRRILTNIISIVPNGNGIATIRFVKRLLDSKTGEELGKTRWTASIGYEYYPTYRTSEPMRLINPLGFKVTSYRIDPEIGAEK